MDGVLGSNPEEPQFTYALNRPGELLRERSRCFRHWSEHWVSRQFLYNFSLLWGLANVTLWGMGELGSLRTGSTWSIEVCMQSSRVFKGTTCSRGCHICQRKVSMLAGVEEYNPNLPLGVVQVVNSCTRGKLVSLYLY